MLMKIMNSMVSLHIKSTSKTKWENENLRKKFIVTLIKIDTKKTK